MQGRLVVRTRGRSGGALNELAGEQIARSGIDAAARPRRRSDHIELRHRRKLIDLRVDGVRELRVLHQARRPSARDFLPLTSASLLEASQAAASAHAARARDDRRTDLDGACAARAGNVAA